MRFNKVTISFIVLQIFVYNIMDTLLHKEHFCSDSDYIVSTLSLLICFNALFCSMFCSLLLNEYGKVCFAFKLQKTNIIDTNIIPKPFDNSKRQFLHNMCTHNPSNKSSHQL